jgi:hypothetical protein
MHHERFRYGQTTRNPAHRTIFRANSRNESWLRALVRLSYPPEARSEMPVNNVARKPISEVSKQLDKFVSGAYGSSAFSSSDPAAFHLPRLEFTALPMAADRGAGWKMLRDAARLYL